MGKSERPVLEVLFPAVRAELLRLLFNAPLKQRYVRELVKMSNLTLHTVQDELRKLTAIGAIVSWSNGYHRFYRPNRNHALFRPLRQIVQLSEKLPRAKSSALHRSRTVHGGKKRLRPRRMTIPRDAAPNWQLFSSPTKTRRL